MKKYKISIIMPNYNGEKYIERSIRSFLLQGYQNKELIIVDGKSTDQSHFIIQSFIKNNINIIWLKYFDKGISNAFNFGLKNASGDIIGYSGSDDILSNNILTTINNNANRVDFDAIYFDSYTFYIKENKKILRKCPDLKFNRKNLIRYGTIVGWQNIFFKKHVYEKYKIDEKNKYSMDYEFYLRIAKENYNYLYVPKIATTNIFDNNISSDLNGNQKKEAYAVLKTYSNWNERYFYLYRLIKITINKYLSKIKNKLN